MWPRPLCHNIEEFSNCLGDFVFVLVMSSILRDNKDHVLIGTSVVNESNITYNMLPFLASHSLNLGQSF